MSVNVHIVTVAQSIAALSWPTGVTVKTFSSMPGNGILTPGIMYPNVENTWGNVAIDEDVAWSVDSASPIDLEYDLGYRYLHCTPQGGPGGIYDIYGGIVAIIASIMVVFMSNKKVTGAVSLRLLSMSKPGIVQDPAGNNFWGCNFTLRIKEFCEVVNL